MPNEFLIILKTLLSTSYFKSMLIKLYPIKRNYEYRRNRRLSVLIKYLFSLFESILFLLLHAERFVEMAESKKSFSYYFEFAPRRDIVRGKNSHPEQTKIVKALQLIFRPRLLQEPPNPTELCTLLDVRCINFLSPPPLFVEHPYVCTHNPG